MTVSAIRRSSFILVLLVALTGLVACGQEEGGDGGEPPAAAEPPKEVTLVATDTAMSFPASVEAEPVSITMRNDGKKPHSAFFARLKQGVTLDKLETAKSEEDFFKLVIPGGAVEQVEPGGTGELTIDLPEGQYVLIREEDRVVAPFEVVPAAGPEVQAPQADYKVEAGDFYFKMPAQITAGQVTFAITNLGGQAHEFGFRNLAAKGEEEGAHMFTPPPGGTVWAQFDIKPGRYTVECHLPDEATGKEHIELGMKTQFTAA